MTDIIDNQLSIQRLLQRLPSFELSYETIAHKKVFDSYNVSIAIPNGKKMFAWFSFQKDKDVCFLMELNRDKKIINIHTLYSGFDKSLCVGTILYGTIIPLDSTVHNDKHPSPNRQTAMSLQSDHVTPQPIPTKSWTEENSFFMMEDIYYYKGLSLKNMVFSEKLGYIEQLFTKKDLIQEFSSTRKILFTLPFLWGIKNFTESDILLEYEQKKSEIPYTVHHLQLRKLNEISPYLNIPLNTILSRINNRDKEKSVIANNHLQKNQFDRICGAEGGANATGHGDNLLFKRSHKIENFIFDYKKPQYKYPTVFQVSADIQFDIYHLFAYGKNNAPVYYNTAYIPNIEKSFFMNKLFRNIRENTNLDYIEESDDEEDFENTLEDKYVDLNKVLNIECVFNSKFKRWVPVRVADNQSRIIHINKLAIY